MFSTALLAVGSFSVLRGALPERMFRTVLGQHWPAVFLSIQILGIRAHEEMPPPLETDLKERFPCNGFKKKECVFFQQLSVSTPRPRSCRASALSSQGLSSLCRGWESLGGLAQ